MTKNPILNALAAAGYIVLVVSLITFISDTQSSKPDTIFAPIIMLSLLTLSVAMMAYLFFYQPFQLFMGNKKKEAANLFVKTIGTFAAFTGVILVLGFSGII